MSSQEKESKEAGDERKVAGLPEPSADVPAPGVLPSAPAPIDSESSSDSDSDSDSEQEYINAIMAKLALNKNLAPPEPAVKVLKEPTLEAVVEYIKSGQCKNIIVMTGAGISVAAGIPDFRTPGTGLYSNLQKYNLPYPEAVFHIDFFKQNPKPFCLLAKELYPGQFDGTTCHYFIRLLHEKGLLLRNFSQNIDTIELVAGIPEEKLVFAHGSFQAAHCIGCRKEYTPQWVKTEIFADKIPRCTCGSLVKPDIVFFGEGLPPRFFELMSTDFAKCDLLIIMGTSLTVQPFASLIHKVRDEVPRLLINREKVGEVNPALAGFVKGLNFGPSGYRDVPILGDLQDGAKKFAQLLGWEAELEALIAQGKAKLAQKAPEPAPAKDAAAVVPLQPESNASQAAAPTPQSTAPETEAKPVEIKPVEAKPVETKPTEAKPVEPKPVEIKPVEAKPVEPKPVETKPVEPKPVETKPTEAKPAETKPAEATASK